MKSQENSTSPEQTNGVDELAHDEIAALAQQIYEEQGRPEGREESHWLEAELRLREEGSGSEDAGEMRGQIAAD